jgi:hypothetical protein
MKSVFDRASVAPHGCDLHLSDLGDLSVRPDHLICQDPYPMRGQAKPSNIQPEKPRASISRSVTPTGFLERGEAKQLGKPAAPPGFFRKP